MRELLVKAMVRQVEQSATREAQEVMLWHGKTVWVCSDVIFSWNHFLDQRRNLTIQIWLVDWEVGILGAVSCYTVALEVPFLFSYGGWESETGKVSPLWASVCTRGCQSSRMCKKGLCFSGGSVRTNLPRSTQETPPQGTLYSYTAVLLPSSAQREVISYWPLRGALQEGGSSCRLQLLPHCICCSLLRNTGVDGLPNDGVCENWH